MRSQAKVIVLPRDLRAATPQKQKPAKRQYRLNKVIMALAMVFLAYSTFIFVRQEIKLRELRQELQAVVTEQQKGRQEQSQLKEDLEFARSDEYVERAAREKLGYLRPGDIFYIINGKSAKQP